jgi:hypothetical protein
MMLAAKFAVVIAVSVAVAEKNCTQSNGYKYSVCGDGLKDAEQTCCTKLQKCVQVKPFSGNDKVTCSADRQLTNSRAVKIIIAPLFFLLLDIGLIVYLVLRCDMKEPTTIVCVVALATAWPFLFSKYWTFGAYTMFLAAMIASAAANSKDCLNMPGWAYRLVWALAIFQLVALFGPMEAFHVPIYDKSKGSNLELINKVYDETGCNTYFENYFTILSIEKEEKEADPDATYNGYCSKNWLATVQAFGVLQSIVWIKLVLVSGRKLLAATAGSGDDVTPLKQP